MAVTSVNVWLVGGDKVIPTSVEKAIQGDGYTVKRISGEDRYETAAKVAEAGISLSGKKPSKVFVASGVSFADALAVSPVAFAKGYPIILTEKDSTSDFSTKELGNIGTDAKILVGGEAVVSKAVAAKLSISESARVAGDDRAVTANLVSDWAKKSEGFNPANAALVGGTNGNGADSLVAASLGGKSFTTLHFAGWDATTTYLKDHAAELTGKGFVFGGTAAVSGDQVSKAQSAAQTVPNVAAQAIKVAPAEDATLVLAAGESVTTGGVTTFTNNSQDDRKYTVSGLDNDLNYRITLVNAANIKKDSSGNLLFKAVADAGSSTGFLADPGTRTATITGVNNAAPALSGTDTNQSLAVAPVAGSLTFTVEGANVESVVPVIYVNGGAGKTIEQGGTSPRLELKASAAGQFASSAEKFGTGGKVSFLDASDLTVTPKYATVQSGGTASIKTQVLDGSADKVMLNGATVKYVVTRGGTVVKTGTATTDDKGVANFEYTGPTVASGAADVADTVSAFVDLNGNGVKDAADIADGSTTVTFSSAVAAATTLGFANETTIVAAVASSQQVTATVVDQYGKPVVNKSVTVSVVRNSTALSSQTLTTDSEGKASVTISGPTSTDGTKTDTVSVTASGLTTATTKVAWVVTPAADVTLSADVVLAVSSNASTFDVAQTATTNAHLTYKASDQYNIVVGGVTTAVDMDAFKKALSVNDTVDGTYSVSGVSVFTLTNG